VIAHDIEYKADDPRWWPRAALVEYTGLSPTRIDQLRTEFGNRWEHGKGAGLRIFAPAFFRAIIAKREESREPREVDQYKSRLTRAQAERAELELATARGEMLSIDEVKQDVQTLCSGVRTGIESCCRHCQDIMRAKVVEAARHFGIEMANGHHRNGKSKTKARTRNSPRSPRQK